VNLQDGTTSEQPTSILLTLRNSNRAASR
jgi:hypothetical protein